jgi:hypothetical protein
MRTVVNLWAGLAVLLLPGLVGCGGLDLEGSWMAEPPVIDGDLGEWEGLMVYNEDPNIAVGTANDGVYLYACASTPLRKVAAQVIVSGLTLWIDPAGGKDRVCGFRYPRGQGLAGFLSPGMSPGGGYHPSGQGERPDPAELIEAYFEDPDLNLEVLDEEGSVVMRKAAQDTAGLSAAMTFRDGILGYEIRIPLSSDPGGVCAVEITRGEPVGIGLISPVPDLSELAEEMRREGRGAGGGRGGFRGGGFGSRRGGARTGFDRPEPLELWIEVTLVEAPGQ